ncbi:MAG: ammonia channel protein [SAR202 cluster bacterium Casp-Chloro-G4]|nr:MAG: ammonia channel protein [SAR202 cluster bacterium Casp-Chloro-G4]
MDSGDTAWVMMSSALVLLMLPGLAFFYGGLVRRKNLLATVMQSFIIMGIVGVQWVLWGYSLAFGTDFGHVIGGFDYIGLKGVGIEPLEGQTIPHLTFMMFQGMFAIITPALITGAFAERMKFSTFIVFTLVWSTLVYAPVAHWVWGGGWIGDMSVLGIGLSGGALDFAGGNVVHITSGVGALAAALVFGKRIGFGSQPMEPNNLILVVLGTGLLWFGWFGFNAGSALAADGIAASAFVATNTAAAMGAVTWMTMAWIVQGKPSVIGAASGAVAGLVAITPAAGFVEPLPAILIGLGAGAFSFVAVQIRLRWKFDDALDVWAVHGVSGTWGGIAVGLFATAALGGVEGLWHGNPGQLVNQLVAIVATWVYAFAITFAILKVLDKLMGIRVTEDEESIGLDMSQHGETPYVE